MAFGMKYLQGAESDKRQSLKKSLDAQSTEDAAGDAPAPVSSAPAAPAVAAQPTSARSRFQRSTPAPAQGSRPAAATPSPTPAAKPAAPKASTSFVPRGQSRSRADEGEELYAEQQERYAAQQSDEDRDHTPDVAVEKQQAGPTRFQLMGMRARRLVQVVGEFKKWPQDQLIAEERRAMREPEAVTNQYLPIYKSEIEPHRQKGYRNLEEAVKKNPNDVVFLLIKADQQRIRQMSPNEAGSQSVLHGSVLESVSASSTMFEPPSSVFAGVKPPAPSEAAPSRPAPKP